MDMEMLGVRETLLSSVVVMAVDLPVWFDQNRDRSGVRHIDVKNSYEMMHLGDDDNQIKMKSGSPGDGKIDRWIVWERTGEKGETRPDGEIRVIPSFSLVGNTAGLLRYTVVQYTRLPLSPFGAQHHFFALSGWAAASLLMTQFIVCASS